MNVDMSEKTVVITGANTGIGRDTALVLAQAGARLILAGRSRERTAPVLDEINSGDGNGSATFVELDLGSLASVRQAAEEILDMTDEIDVLINNAGLAGARGVTEDGFEMHFGINHLGHFLLTNLLLERIKESSPARIVNVASKAHYIAKKVDFDAFRGATKSATGMSEYQVSKLANVLFSQELARRLEGTGVTTYSLHPGVVASDIWREVPALIRPLVKLFMISTEEGARASLHCAMSEQAGQETGLYYDADGSVKKESKLARDQELAAELWRRSEEWTQA